MYFQCSGEIKEVDDVDVDVDVGRRKRRERNGRETETRDQSQGWMFLVCEQYPYLTLPSLMWVPEPGARARVC